MILLNNSQSSMSNYETQMMARQHDLETNDASSNPSVCSKNVAKAESDRLNFFGRFDSGLRRRSFDAVVVANRHRRLLGQRLELAAQQVLQSQAAALGPGLVHKLDYFLEWRLRVAVISLTSLNL